MKTGYFAELKKGNLTGAISIAIGAPKYVDIRLAFKPFAPEWNLLKNFRDGMIDEAGYIERFQKQLDKLDAKEVYQHIHTMTGEEEPVIMCHCATKHFCHRHLVAEWLEKELGVEIEERSMGRVTREAGCVSIKQDEGLFDD